MKIGERINLQASSSKQVLSLVFQVFICSLPMTACTLKSSHEGSPKFQQYFVQGEQLYLTHCSNCHQQNGSGLGLLYPPLDTSDYMQDNLKGVICLIRNGKNGALTVNGKSYNQEMPGNKKLSDLEIAQIATYVYNSWSHQQGIIEVKETSKILSGCDSLSSR